MKDELEQVSAEELPASKPTASPFGSAFNVTVSIPQSVEIRMVDASTLADYEVWAFLASAVVGFVVASIQEPDDLQLKLVAVMFGVLFVIAGGMAFGKRKQLKSEAKRIRLKTTDVEEIT